jgi:phage regulator Rha-like protein
MPQPAPVPDVLSLVLTLRGKRVLLDSDLANLYGVPTKAFNQTIQRNAARFPADFLFQLTREELTNLRSQFVTSSSEDTVHQQLNDSDHGGRRYLPYVFTEHGAIMAAMLLRSERAIHVSVFVIRAFVQMREALAANATILKKLAEIDRTLIEHDAALRAIWHQLQPLLQPPPEAPKRRIGFLP